ncbi:MAG TPA: Crp/Fnr family transcriptional regulator [Caulobacteraceae bacterium]|nr:Crp/Fnr family transcriptional regulator [Caulobacteraceae bacterium]
MTRPLHPLKNRLLAALSPEDFQLLSPHLAHVELEKGRLLYDPGDEIDVAYFPDNAVISLMTLMNNGDAIVNATIGREGALGLTIAVAPRQAYNRAVVQVAGHAWRIAARPLHEAWQRRPAISLIVDRHGDALFAHAAQSVACNALHTVEARLSRWLLACRDRIDGDTIPLTQEYLASMLGVQRTTVTAVAGALQAKGLIRYRRGVVDILDRAGLEAIACECYARVRDTYARLLPATSS